jgi:hypothetical protein
LAADYRVPLVLVVPGILGHLPYMGMVEICRSESFPGGKFFRGVGQYTGGNAGYLRDLCPAMGVPLLSLAPDDQFLSHRLRGGPGGLPADLPEYPSWKQFLIAGTIVASILSLVFDPIMVIMNIYQPLKWHYIFSIPIFVAMTSFCKWLTEFIVKHTQTT